MNVKNRPSCFACDAGIPKHQVAYHGGREIRSDKPQPGIRTVEKLDPKFQEVCDQEGIDLTMETHLATCRGKCAYCECRHSGDSEAFAAGFCECARDGGPWVQPNQHEYVPTHEHADCAPAKRAVLIGDWVKQPDGLYGVNQDGEAGFAATVIDGKVVVMQSKTLSQGALHAPSVDLEILGGWLGYDLPERLRKTS